MTEVPRRSSSALRLGCQLELAEVAGAVSMHRRSMKSYEWIKGRWGRRWEAKNICTHCTVLLSSLGEEEAPYSIVLESGHQIVGRGDPRS